MVALMAPVSGRMSDRYPASVTAGGGLGLLATGLLSWRCSTRAPAMST